VYFVPLRTLLFLNHKSAAGAPPAKDLDWISLWRGRGAGSFQKLGYEIDVSSPDSFRSAPTGNEKNANKSCCGFECASSVPYLQKVL